MPRVAYRELRINLQSQSFPDPASGFHGATLDSVEVSLGFVIEWK